MALHTRASRSINGVLQMASKTFLIMYECVIKNCPDHYIPVNAIKEFSLFWPSWVMSHYTMLYK